MIFSHIEDAAHSGCFLWMLTSLPTFWVSLTQLKRLSSLDSPYPRFQGSVPVAIIWNISEEWEAGLGSFILASFSIVFLSELFFVSLNDAYLAGI